MVDILKSVAHFRENPTYNVSTTLCSVVVTHVHMLSEICRQHFELCARFAKVLRLQFEAGHNKFQNFMSIYILQKLID